MLQEINLDNISQIQCSFQMNDQGGILVAKIEGKYNKGSIGNNDGIYIFSKVCSYYLSYEPLILITDVSLLDYEWGNTILRTLNFFYEIGRDESEKEKELIIVLSKHNELAIKKLLQMTNAGKRIIFNDFNEALFYATTQLNNI